MGSDRKYKAVLGKYVLSVFALNLLMIFADITGRRATHILTIKVGCGVILKNDMEIGRIIEIGGWLSTFTIDQY